MPANASSELPLTPLQHGMLYHWLQNPQSGADIEQMVCTLPEKIEPARLREAWERAARRHDALRLYCDWSGAEPVQHLAQCIALPWEERTVTRADIPSFLNADRFAGFDLGAAPLMRFTVLRLAENDWRLVWTFHHLLLDGRSITRLLHEVFADYDGAPLREATRRAASLSNYLTWRFKQDYTASIPFWREHLRGVHGPTALVIDNLGTPGALPSQQEADHVLSAETTAALNALAENSGSTLNTVVQAAWALLLSRYSGEDSVIFGATRACRHSACEGAADLTALLINTVPVHAVVAGDQPLVPWLQSLRRAWMEMRPHELTPLPIIRRAAGLLSDKPLFNHLVVFENEDFTEALHRLEPGWRHRTFDLRELTTVPLTLQVYGGKSLRLHSAFDSSKFDPAFIRRMLGHIAHLLTQFAASPGAVLDSFTIATPGEVSALAPTRPLTTFPGGTTLHQWFTETAARFPHRTAVSGSHGAWSYLELDQRSNAIAAALISAGIQRGDLTGLLMDRTGTLTAAILGILKAGSAYLPIDPAYPANRAAFMLADAGVKVLLTDTAMSKNVPSGTFQTIDCDSLPVTAAAPDISPHLPDDTAYVIYTSGSTGQPKGCMISHRNVVRLMRATEPWFAFHECDVWTLFHSSAFDFSVWEIWGALLYGGRLCVVPWLTTRSPDDFCRLLCQEGVTVLNQTPSAFRQLIAAEPLARSSDPSLPPFALRTVIFGGEALEMHSLRPWFDRHGDQKPQLVNMYGITETTVHVTYRPVTATDLDHGSVIGKPITDLQLHVLDRRSRQPAPVGIPGEMYVAGPGLAKGYLNRPELTAERFPESWLPRGPQEAPASHPPDSRLYKTGDLARLIPSRDGLDLEFLGRIDDQVKIRGFRIELGEIESVLCSHPDIRESCVLVHEDRPGDKRLCAWFVSVTPPSAAELRAHLKSRLPDYMIPAAFVAMESFPLTTNGKLDRRGLPAPVLEQSARSFTAPSTSREIALASIWQKVLRIPQVGIHDNFFELGGDSILSIQVIARARDAGLRLTPRQLFENPTVAALAGIIIATPGRTVPVAEIPGAFPPSPIQQWFLDQELQGANHWNQTFLFSVCERLNTDALAGALRSVIAHHSALRLRFIRRNNIWEQSVHPAPDDEILSLHNLAGYAEALLTKQIERACRVEQARLSFEFGPLLRAAYFDSGEDRPGRLLIAVHHLAVDGVSWRILLEDIETAYRQITGGKSVTLPAATAPFSAWAEQVRAWPGTAAAKSEASFWQHHLTRCEAAATLREDDDDGGSNTEAESYTLRTRLSRADTDALLHQVPATWRTRINDALLAALVHSIHNCYPVPDGLAIHLEGHGREQHIGGTLDVSRTVGWFTTIFPVCLMPSGDDMASQVRSVQQQLNALPGNGSGYSALGLKHDAAILFNYLGRMDSVTEGSELFSFAPEPTGPWHCQSAGRKYQIEINAMVTGGELEVAWTAGRNLHSEQQIKAFADGFHAALQGIIRESGASATAPDTSLSGLNADDITRLTKGQTGIVEISALAPMQQLFYSASLPRPGAGYDQWHCHLRGPLDVNKLQSAWSAVFARHSILRSSFHSAGLPHPVQIVREGIEPEWLFRDLTGSDPRGAIARLLTDDSGVRNDLTKPVLSRITLVRFAPDHHFLLWSLPDLHLDGWSWPVVFSEVNEFYNGNPGNLPQARPYNKWLHYLAAKPGDQSLAFWRGNLRGITAPTPLPVDLTPGPKSPRRFAETSLKLTASKITSASRSLSVSPGALVQAAWALLLARGAGATDVVFGTAFSGRPSDLQGADRIVGPFVNNLPVRLSVDPNAAAASLLQSLQTRLFDISEHQYTPLTTVQECTGIPWQCRVFNSLTVFQNYEIPDSARHFGEAKITDFSGPIHTNYPLTLVVTPGDEWNVSLIFQETACSSNQAKLILDDFAGLLLTLAADPSALCGAIMAKCKIAEGSSIASAAEPLRRPGGAAPRTRMEKTLTTLWERAFGLTDLTTEDNFFDLGGGSLLMVRLHAAIRMELGRDVPLLDLFRFPTIGGLARQLDPAAATAAAPLPVMDQTASRAAAARAAASRARDLRTR